MNRLSFNENEFKNADQKDLMKFMSMITEDQRFKNNGTIFANSIKETDDLKTPTMMTVEISFQFIRPKEKGIGRRFVWTSYRAKSHTCSNTNIREILC
jgi:hypothetical protein